jgi:hypothetical protein
MAGKAPRRAREIRLHRLLTDGVRLDRVKRVPRRHRTGSRSDVPRDQVAAPQRRAVVFTADRLASAADGENAVCMLQAEVGPRGSLPEVVREHHDLVVGGLGAIEQGRKDRDTGVVLPPLDDRPVDHVDPAPCPECGREIGCQLGTWNSVIQGNDRDGHGHRPGSRPHPDRLAELHPERFRERERDLRRPLEERLEPGAVDAQDVCVPGGARGGRARRRGDESQLAKGRPAAEDSHHVAVGGDDLEPSRPDQKERIALLPLPKEPISGVQMELASVLRDLLSRLSGKLGEDRRPLEEVRRRLGTRTGGAAAALAGAGLRGLRRGAGSGSARVKTSRAAEPSEGERLVSSSLRSRRTPRQPIPATIRQTAEKVQALSNALSTDEGSSGFGDPRIATTAATPRQIYEAHGSVGAAGRRADGAPVG